ncbi:MAG: DUF2330 domain-containing protein [Polyangiaceae bacterium]|nr:DUF2330 domain-containing protein [Polyangiaceae bacterium]
MKHSIRFFKRSAFFAALLATTTLAPRASASPVLYAGSGTEKVHSTDVLIMQKDGASVVTVMADYEGPLQSFAMIIPVPKSVKRSGVETIKREFLTRVEQLSAPKFAEFWEMDPCDEGKLEQTWQQDRTAKAETAFLGSVETKPSEKVAKELLLDVNSKKKKGEYADTFLGSGEKLTAWLKKKNLSLPTGGEASISSYADQGYQFLALEVDGDQVELIGGDRAQLSPIRYNVPGKVNTVPARFGLPSAAKEQELLIYTMAPGQRVQVKNYPTQAAPTNLTVDFKVKEKVGEYYAALHDKYLKKHPGTFLLEYAYPTSDCGKPCATEPLLPHELLSLGADYFESKLSSSIKNPPAPEPTEEEELKLEGRLMGKNGKEKATIKREWEASRKELAARKALLERNEYILSRLHYRYAAGDLPQDPELGGGAAIEGGIGLPLGEFGAASLEVEAADENHFQTRFNSLHENIKVVKCDKPQYHRWGKPPRTYRGANKIWVANDLARRKRSKIKPEEVTMTAFPDLGIPGKIVQKEESKPQPVAKKEEGGCSYASRPWSGSGGSFLLAALGLLGWATRRRIRG